MSGPPRRSQRLHLAALVLGIALGIACPLGAVKLMFLAQDAPAAASSSSVTARTRVVPLN